VKQLHLLKKSNVTLINGDCLDVMQTIQDHSIDMIFADLPYGMVSCKWDSIIPLDRLWAEYNRITKKTTPIVLTSMQPFTSVLVNSNLKHFRYEWIWQKAQATGFLNAHNQPLRIHENILVFYKKLPTYNPQFTKATKTTAIKTTPAGGHQVYRPLTRDREWHETGRRFPVSVNKIAHDKKRLHPTQKPVALAEYFIKTYTNEGDTVLDNVMGSGTTGEACVKLGRHFIGIEKELAYFDGAKARIEGLRDEAIATRDY
jgi:site-specific DNA-methyltransferase (adenine-specific)